MVQVQVNPFADVSTLRHSPVFPPLRLPTADTCAHTGPFGIAPLTSLPRHRLVISIFLLLRDLLPFTVLSEFELRRQQRAWDIWRPQSLFRSWLWKAGEAGRELLCMEVWVWFCGCYFRIVSRTFVVPRVRCWLADAGAAASLMQCLRCGR